MPNLSLEDAYDLLGLSIDAGEDELDAAYRKLSKKHHPDKPHGDTKQQARINEARTIVSAAVRLRKKALVPIQVEKSLQQFGIELAAERAARRANDVVISVKRRSVWPLQRLKYFSLVLAGFAGAFGWFGNVLLPEVFSSFALESAGPGSIQLRILMVLRYCALAFTGAAGISQFLVRQYLLNVEVFIERLGNISLCAKILAEALDFENLNNVGEGYPN